MENQTYTDELQHHGIKGMKWGQRLYQNKDGSLTPLGQKRYNKEVEKLKKETAKVRAEEKAAANRKKTQDKFDKLEAKKQALEERKKALRGEVDGKAKEDNSPEAIEARREKLLKSTNAKELYENKDVLSYQELNDRINRIDLEARLQSKIIEEPKKTGLDYVNDIKKVIDTATNFYKSVDSAYSTVANSAIGKTLAKQLGIELPKTEKSFNLNDFYKNMNKKSAAEIKEVTERLKNENSIRDEFNRRENKKKADAEYAKKVAAEKKAAKAKEKEAKNADKEREKEAKKNVEKEASNDNATKKTEETTKNTKSEPDVEYAKSDGKVYGEGTSRSKYASDTSYSKSESDRPIINATYEEIKTSNSYTDSGQNYATSLFNNTSSGSRSSNSSAMLSIGQSYIAGYLEDKR